MTNPDEKMSGSHGFGISKELQARCLNGTYSTLTHVSTFPRL